MATDPRPELPDDQTGRPSTRPRLRLVHSTSAAAPRPAEPRRRKRAAPGPRSDDEAGTTTAEYTVVTAAAVAFGALLLKLLTGGWGERILETAFREVIKMLGF